jgi:hypothetical protein
VSPGHRDPLSRLRHDLNQPLHAISQAVDLIQRDAAGLSEHTRHLLEQIDATVRTMREHVNNVTDFAKIQGVGLKSTPSISALAPCLRNVEDHLAPVFRAAGVKLRVRHCPWHAHTDPYFIERILSIMLCNGRSAQSSAVLVAARRRGETVRIEVRDSGRGFSDAQVESILQDRAVDSGPGTQVAGYGWPVAKAMARLIGAELGIQSAPGKGTTVSITIPEASPPHPDNGHTDASDLPAKGDTFSLTGKIILLVDADARSLAAAVDLVESWGAIAIPSESGAVCIQRLSVLGLAPDLLVCHWRDSDCIRDVRARSEGTIPAIIVSRLDDPPRGVAEIHLDNTHSLSLPAVPRSIRALFEQCLRTGQ